MMARSPDHIEKNAFFGAVLPLFGLDIEEGGLEVEERRCMYKILFAKYCAPSYGFSIFHYLRKLFLT